jgi:hypothetical protein
VGWFWDEYRANVREYRRTWKRRLLRRLVALLLVVLITPIALLVRHLTGSNAAGAIVAVSLLLFAIFVWWWIEDRLYEDADARYFASLEAEEAARHQPPMAEPYPAATMAQRHSAAFPVDSSAPIPAVLVDEVPSAYASARPTNVQPIYPPKYPQPMPSAPHSGGSGWAVAAAIVVGCVLLMCGGVVGGGVLLIRGGSHAQRSARQDVQDRMDEVRRQHDEQMREIERRHQEMRERFERDRERMRRPGW